MSEEKMIYTKTRTFFTRPFNEIIDLTAYKEQSGIIRLHDTTYRVRDLNTANETRVLKVVPAFTNYFYILEHDTHPLLNRLLITETPTRLNICFRSIIGIENRYVINTSPTNVSNPDRTPSVFIDALGRESIINFRFELSNPYDSEPPDYRCPLAQPALRFKTPRKYQRKSPLIPTTRLR